MLKLKSHTLLLLVLCSIFDISSSFSQAPGIEWQSSMGGTGAEYLTSIEQTSDNGYIVGGYSYSGISGDKTETNIGGADYWILKLDTTGNIEWQNSIGGNGNDDLRVIHQTSDNGFIVGGYSKSGISGDKAENGDDNDYWILKLDVNGNIVWQNTIWGHNDDFLFSICESSDGGYLLGGYSQSCISGDKTENVIGSDCTMSFYPDYWIVKLNALGNIEWQNTIGGNGSDYLQSVCQTPDGGYVLGGYSDSNISGDKTENTHGVNDYWIIKVNNTGNIIWQNTIGGSSNDELNDMKLTSDGGVIVAGYTYSGISGDKTETNIGSSDYWVLKLDSTGNIEWQNTIGGSASDHLFSVCNTSDDGYILCGESNSPISGDKTENYIVNNNLDIWILKINDSGNIVWQNTIGGSGTDWVQSINLTNDGGFIIGSYSMSFISGDKTENPYGQADYWVIKLFPDCAMAPELCNTLDDNCNGLIDDGIIETISISAAGPTTFCQGGSVVLSAIYSGATVQWKKDGVNIAGATSSNYTVTKKGNYTCVTTSPCGTATSSIINVIVNKNPNASISAGGATTFCAGGSVTLTEVPSGGCTYQWYKGPSAIVGATTINYIATTTGNYKCRVTKTATGCFKNSNGILVTVTCRENAISSEPIGEEIVIFPNPNNGKFTISVYNFTSIASLATGGEIGVINIYNSFGQIIYRGQINSSETAIDISEFAGGIYFVKIKSGADEIIKKLIKE